MKRFIVSVLCATVFFVGLGNLLERANASLKSDDKALELLGKSRAAIGGDAAVGGVKSMTILGKTTKTFEVEGVSRTENGESEINFELPNRLSRKMKIGSGSGDRLVDKQLDLLIFSKGDGDNLKWKTAEPTTAGAVRQVTIVKKDGSSEEVRLDAKEPLVLRRTDGETVLTEDGKTATVDGRKVLIRKMQPPVGGGELPSSNELLRTTLSLLLTAPEGLDVSYTYLGEGTVDGASVDIIAASDGASTFKLYLDKSTSLPRMISYRSQKPFVIMLNKNADKPGDGETKIFERRAAAPEMAEFQVKFSDFRAVNGLQLPFKWTQTVDGKDDEVLDIASYEVNPANIADKFKEEPVRVFMRTKQQ